MVAQVRVATTQGCVAGAFRRGEEVMKMVDFAADLCWLKMIKTELVTVLVSLRRRWCCHEVRRFDPVFSRKWRSCGGRRLTVADLWWLPAWWRLGFEEKLGFLMGEMKMMMWQCMVGQFGEWRIMTRVIMWLDRFRR
ncbi:hypothetical protein DEO72_LG5g2193 [Vigna unguiculata]|uniref:Uncharacterized protein n=1 Tax=Vigna unguiculata TaxID=3917 RepID=A0A4D6M241_VIGUN|nr:hypothetical protein DEO72_LG5g2193 [Vigna unguiculata]